MASNQIHRQGFTIVELLIVIVVIGILAAITVVAYNGVQNRAYDTSAQSDLSNAGKQIEIYRINNPDETYPSSSDAATLRTQLGSINLKITKSAYLAPIPAYIGVPGNFVYIDNNAGTEFAIIATAKSGKTFYYSSLNKTVKEYPATNFPSGGLLYIRPKVFDPVVNNGAGVWGYGDSGWASAWIK